MLAIWVKVRVKPDMRQKFLDAIEVDALGSERDEPGCARFNVLQDSNDQNVYYFYEVYADEAAIEAHRAAPHYAVWQSAADNWTDRSSGWTASPCSPPIPNTGSRASGAYPREPQPLTSRGSGPRRR